MHDLHVHLDFMANGEAVAADAAAAGSMLFANTVTPDGYRAARGRFAKFGNVRVGFGMHPWWVDGRLGIPGILDELESAAPDLIGEVGLDLGRRHADTRESQLEAFAAIARWAGKRGGKVLSIHSVNAAREALDILESAGALERCTCIFHWYTGPSDQLKRAIDLGCLFSVGPRMTSTRKGREYVKAIPARQLLLETDLPAARGDTCPFADVRRSLEEAARAIVLAKGEGALDTIAATSLAVLF